MKIEELFKNIEKVLRYLLPAFVLIILLKIFKEDIYTKYVSKLRPDEFIFYLIRYNHLFNS